MSNTPTDVPKKYSSPYPDEFQYTSDKNFIVRLKVLIDEHLREYGIRMNEEFFAHFNNAEDYFFSSKSIISGEKDKRIAELEGDVLYWKGLAEAPEIGKKTIEQFLERELSSAKERIAELERDVMGVDLWNTPTKSEMDVIAAQEEAYNADKTLYPTFERFLNKDREPLKIGDLIDIIAFPFPTQRDVITSIKDGYAYFGENGKIQLEYCRKVNVEWDQKGEDLQTALNKADAKIEQLEKEVERRKDIIKMLFMAYRDKPADEKWAEFESSNNL